MSTPRALAMAASMFHNIDEEKADDMAANVMVAVMLTFLYAEIRLRILGEEFQEVPRAAALLRMFLIQRSIHHRTHVITNNLPSHGRSTADCWR